MQLGVLALCAIQKVPVGVVLVTSHSSDSHIALRCNTCPAMHSGLVGQGCRDCHRLLLMTALVGSKHPLLLSRHLNKTCALQDLKCIWLRAGSMLYQMAEKESPSTKQE